MHYIFKGIVLALVAMAQLVANAQQADTVYSGAISSFVLVDGQAVPQAEINYTLYDTVNANSKLIRAAFTDSLGMDKPDSLPVLKYQVRIDDPAIQNQNGVSITNNGTGSDHLIKFTSDAEEVAKEGYIVNLLGQKVTTIPVQYNPATKTYDAVWHGQEIQEGVYIAHILTSKGPVASKIKHVKDRPSVIDYGKVPESKDDEGLKSTDGVTGDLAKTKYAINITHVGLEDFVDTVWMIEDTPHDFFFNVTGVQYADGTANGWVDFTVGGSPTDANVEYKQLNNQTEIFNTTAPNGFYQLVVPVVYEASNPGETQYIVTLTENGDPFVTEIDTVLVAPGDNYFQHYVVQQSGSDEQDIEGIVRNVYTKQPEAGVTVRVINRTTGDLIEEDITTSNGEYYFENIAAGTLVEFELGKSGELWMVNNEYDIPDEIIDTLVTFNRYFYPKTMEVPQVGTNTTIQGDGGEVTILVGTDKINFEEILRDIDYMWANGPTGTYWSARSEIANLFYEGNSPIVTANTQRNITNSMQYYYEPYTNFYPGQLGWNVNFGSGNLTTPIFATTNYGVTAIMGGDMMMSAQLANYIKEMQGRRMWFGDVPDASNGGWVSYMNNNPSMPGEKDRAYTHLILINQNGRFDVDEETYSCENLTSVEPTSKATSGIGHTDIPGNKPHCKHHLNTEKLAGQIKLVKQIPGPTDQDPKHLP